MEPSVRIQKGLAAGQLPAAVALFDVAFEAKMALAIPDGGVRRRFFGSIFSPDSCLCALVDQTVIGILGFQTTTEAFSGGITGVGVPWRQIREHLGLFAAIRAALFFALFRRQPKPDTLLLDGVTVDPKLRGRGVGRLLLKAVIEYAAAQGFKQVKLGVLDTNVGAKALYEKVGFVVLSKTSLGLLGSVLGFGGYYTMVCSIDQNAKAPSSG